MVKKRNTLKSKLRKTRQRKSKLRKTRQRKSKQRITYKRKMYPMKTKKRKYKKRNNLSKTLYKNKKYIKGGDIYYKRMSNKLVKDTAHRSRTSPCRIPGVIDKNLIAVADQDAYELTELSEKFKNASALADAWTTESSLHNRGSIVGMIINLAGPGESFWVVTAENTTWVPGSLDRYTLKSLKQNKIWQGVALENSSQPHENYKVIQWKQIDPQETSTDDWRIWHDQIGNTLIAEFEMLSKKASPTQEDNERSQQLKKILCLDKRDDDATMAADTNFAERTANKASERLERSLSPWEKGTFNGYVKVERVDGVMRDGHNSNSLMSRSSSVYIYTCNWTLTRDKTGENFMNPKQMVIEATIAELKGIPTFQMVDESSEPTPAAKRSFWMNQSGIIILKHLYLAVVSAVNLMNEKNSQHGLGDQLIIRREKHPDNDLDVLDEPETERLFKSLFNRNVTAAI